MAFSTLSLKQFRSYRDFAFNLSPDVNIIVGKNGTGKTNLLEAVYVLAHGSSFRVSDKDLIMHDEAWFRLEGSYGDQQRVVTYDLTRIPGKEFVLDNVKRRRLGYQQRLPLVLFEPNELRLFSGSPVRRRDYIDEFMDELWPTSGQSKRRFERALLQRNKLLKSSHSRSTNMLADELFVWDLKLADYATHLVEARRKLIAIWNDRLSDIYSSIAMCSTIVHVTYQTTITSEHYSAELLRRLTSDRQTDILRGFTGVGPHRDDIIVTLDGRNASVSASRGELRTLVLALKILELQLVEAETARKPLLLLDDVFSELDGTRRRALTEQARRLQTIITTTEADTATQYFGDNCSFIALKER